MIVAQPGELEHLSDRLAKTCVVEEPAAEEGQSSSTPDSTTLGSQSPSPNSGGLQLDQLANTNLLTIRVKWSKPQATDPRTSELVGRLSEVAHSKRGFALNPSVIENYEYLSDKTRLAVLKENQETYVHEFGTEEVATSQPTLKSENAAPLSPPSSPPHSNSAWLYDFVFQSQFKQWADLVTARDDSIAALRQNETVTRWSVSENAHALTHPGNLYVRGIPKDLTIDDLMPIFGKFGPVLALKIICDTTTGQSLGYGFLSYPLGSQASRCIKELNGNLMNGSPLFINYHVERKERERIHWDHVKEDNDDERFKGIFIRNLPTENEDKKIVAPEDVVAKFESELAVNDEPVQILSYYLPKRNSNSEVEYDDNDDKINNVEICAARNEECPLKGYGFIKFGSHAQALRAIQKFHDMEWLGVKLIVNKAVQSKPHVYHHHQHHHQHNNNSHHTQNYKHQNDHRNRRNSERSNPARQASMSNISFYAPFNGSPSGLGFLSNTMPIYSHAAELDPHDTAAGFSPVPSPSPHQPYIPPAAMPHMLFGAAPSLSTTPESSTAPSSRNGSIFQRQSQNSLIPHSPFMLPIPTKDQQESNLYVKHLPLTWRDEDFYQFYEKFGEIISAKIITVGGSKNGENTEKRSQQVDDSALGTSRGYGFVCFKNPLDASRAMMITDRYQVDEDHTLYVSFAQKRAKSVSNGDSVKVPVNEDRSHSARRSFHYGQHPGTDVLGNYNAKFLSAMMQQQNGMARARGSWPVALGPQMPPH
ncbi:LADA_0B00782g1_1 [Lachancea dasiensis]|uniref:LADA_0B00782g1_1 n=1 Tax=Lachancea dasiensis TaxID=1072105 RepID=A0A1G4IRP2_9SACH|nr:LADA_0B00782g1_1 [Lachancea dasiensis]